MPWWLVLFPGVAITITVLAFNLLGDGIRDMFVTFWLGAFVSSVALSLFKNVLDADRLAVAREDLKWLQ